MLPIVGGILLGTAVCSAITSIGGNIQKKTQHPTPEQVKEFMNSLPPDDHKIQGPTPTWVDRWLD